MALKCLILVVVLVEVPSKSTPPQYFEYGLGVIATSNSGCSSSMVRLRVVVLISVSNFSVEFR